MSMTNDANRYTAVDQRTTFTGLDLFAGIVAALMILGPLTAAATHASHQGWPTEQLSETR